MSDSRFASVIRSARRRPLWNSKTSTHQVAIGRDAIERMLPHRGPMLMLDSIGSVDLEQRGIRASRAVAVDDPVFAGHFPGEPVYPAFLQFEIAGQAGLCLLEFLRRDSTEVSGDARPRGVRLVRAHDGVLVNEIHPGDVLTALALVLDDNDLTSLFAAQVLKGDTVCSAIILEVCFVAR